jgi:hypothetical protein
MDVGRDLTRRHQTMIVEKWSEHEEVQSIGRTGQVVQSQVGHKESEGEHERKAQPPQGREGLPTS